MDKAEEGRKERMKKGRKKEDMVFYIPFCYNLRGSCLFSIFYIVLCYTGRFMLSY